MIRIRLLPMVIVGAVGVLGIQVDQLRREWPTLSINDAQAKSSADKSAEQGGGAGAMPAGETAMAKNEDAAMTGDKPAMADGKAQMASGEEKSSRPPLVSGTISKGELEVLQSLAKRRETLEERSEQLRLQENLLTATEKRIDEKIAQLKTLEDQIKKLLRQHDKEREEQLKSLVKVYENMKPKDAARIFEQLEMDILLQVTGRMREAKMAPVLAAMDPEKAKDLTVRLATQRTLPVTGGKEG